MKKLSLVPVTATVVVLDNDLGRQLREVAQAMPPGSMISVPREWLLGLLRGYADPHDWIADLTVADIVDRYGRAASTVRAWIDAGRFPGAYRFRNREWRVPVSSLKAFEAGERKRKQMPPRPSNRRAVSPSPDHPWRKTFPGTAPTPVTEATP